MAVIFLNNALGQGETSLNESKVVTIFFLKIITSMSKSWIKRFGSSCLMIHRVAASCNRPCNSRSNIIGCYINHHLINKYTTSTIKYCDNNDRNNINHTLKDNHIDHGPSNLDINTETNANADIYSNTNTDNSTSSPTNKIKKSNKIKKTYKMNRVINIENHDYNDDKDNSNVEIWDWVPPENKNISTIISKQQQRDNNMNTNYIIPRIEGVLLKPEEVQLYLSSQGAEKCIVLNINGFAEFKYFVIATGRSVRHIRKMSESIVSTVSVVFC